MKTSTRALRARISAIPGLQSLLSARDIARRETIMRGAEATMADFGRETFSVAQLANALEISPGVIRRHFIDLEGLLVEILERHLRALSDAIGRVPDDAPDPPAARRAAYLAFTRTPKGGPTEAHLLLTRDRFTLPPEDQEKLDVMRLGLGAELGGVTAESVLSLLDSPTLGSDEIEALIARRAAQFAAELAALAVPPVPPEAPAEAAPDSMPIRPEPDIPKPPPWTTGPDDEPWPESVFDRHMRAQRARAGP